MVQTSLLLAVAPSLALAGCGRQARGRLVWQRTLPWNTGVTRGLLPGGRPVGPVAAAVGAHTIALADTFAQRVLLWRRDGRRWRGSTAVAVAAQTGVVDLALVAGRGPTRGYAVDGDGALWRLPAAGAATVWTRLRPLAGSLQVISGLAVAAGGVPVVDVTFVTRHETSRRILNLARPVAQVVGAATIARAVRDGSPSVPWLLTPPGVRRAMVGGARGIWVLGRGPGGAGAVLAELSLQGKVVARRPFPALPGPIDLLGVDARSAYALTAAGTARARVVALDRQGRVASGWYLPHTHTPPDANVPELPHPVALGASGELLVLVAEAAGLHLRLFSALP